MWSSLPPPQFGIPVLLCKHSRTIITKTRNWTLVEPNTNSAFAGVQCCWERCPLTLTQPKIDFYVYGYLKTSLFPLNLWLPEKCGNLYFGIFNRIRLNNHLFTFFSSPKIWKIKRIKTKLFVCLETLRNAYIN